MECLKGKEAARKRKQYMDENRKQSYIVQTRPTKDTRPVLTDEQKQIVTCTWDIVKKDISRVGVITFLRLFEKYPDMQQIFVPFRGLTRDELRNCDKLRQHGLRVMGTVDKCISRLDETPKLEALLHELGHKHVTFNI